MSEWFSYCGYSFPISLSFGCVLFMCGFGLGLTVKMDKERDCNSDQREDNGD